MNALILAQRLLNSHGQHSIYRINEIHHHAKKQ